MRQRIAARLEHEFRVIDKIDHPNVVKLWECGTHEDRTYGVLDWVDGPSVRAHLRRLKQEADDLTVLRLAIDCAQALAAVHRSGYLHGDVHAGNFMIKDGSVCLIDFGLARPIVVPEGKEADYSEGGVVYYMPPEYVRKSRGELQGLWNSIAAEVYSCAVIIYTLFTNRYPYESTLHREEYLSRVLEQPPLSFADCGRAPFPELERTLAEALAKEPSDRFSSMPAFAAALAGAADQLATE
jgi:serine/threonine-protein kinase